MPKLLQTIFLFLKDDMLLTNDLAEAFRGGRPIDNIPFEGQVGFGELLGQLCPNGKCQWLFTEDDQVEIGVG